MKFKIQNKSYFDAFLRTIPQWVETLFYWSRQLFQGHSDGSQHLLDSPKGELIDPKAVRRVGLTVSKRVSSSSNPLLSHFGFSLPEVLVAAGFLVAVGGLVGTVVVGLRNSQKKIEDKNDFSQFLSVMENSLKTDYACEKAFMNGVSLPLPESDKPGQAVSISLPDFWRAHKRDLVGDLYNRPRLGLGVGETSMIVGPEQNPRIRLVSIEMQVLPTPPMDVAVSVPKGSDPNQREPKSLKRFLSRVVFRAEQLDGSGRYHLLPPGIVELPVFGETTGGKLEIEKCMVQLESADVCQVTGGSGGIDWVEGKEIDPKRKSEMVPVCRQSDQCQILGAWQNATCSPGYNPCPGRVPHSETGKFGCPPKTISVSTGSYQGPRFLVSCGKKCSQYITPTITLFLCMKCPF